MINQIVQLGVLAVLTRSAYFLAEVYSPKVEISPRVNPGGSELEEFIARLKGSGKKHEVELVSMFPSERIEQIKKRELRHYKAAQDKKWENWLEGVSK